MLPTAPPGPHPPSHDAPPPPPRGHWPRSRSLLAVLAVLATLLLPGAASVLDDRTGVPAGASGGTLYGAYNGAGDTAAAARFDTWQGRRQAVVADFVPSTSWAALSSPTWLADDWKGKGYRLALSVPMLPQSGADLATGARGSYNGYFRTLSQVLVSRGLGTSIIRLGWEMNGTWFAWSAVSNPSAYTAYWRQVVTTMRSVSGAAFTFDWAPNIGSGTAGFDNTRAYPGDAYVDVIGMSMYDQSWTYAPSAATDRWRELVDQPYGLAWNAGFAKAHGKSSGFGEWGLSLRCDGHGGGDDPYYVQQIRGWMDAHPYYYATYFDRDSRSCEKHAITTGTFPKGAAAYKQAFGGALRSLTSSSSLRVSWHADRSDAQSLDWVGLSGPVYVFLDPAVATGRVRFYLDDTGRSRAPMSTELTAPWDLKGGTTSRANPFDASRLAAGTHTLTVVADTQAGANVVTSTFLR